MPTNDTTISQLERGTDADFALLGLWGGEEGVRIKLPVWKDPHPVQGFRDTVHLCLAYAIDPAAASANDANARIEVRSWHARPTTVNDGAPLGEFSP